MSVSPATQPAVSLAQRLSAVRVGLRQDLEFSRHVFRGEVCYVVRDPVTFQSHRLDAHDYEILMRIRPERTLAEIFADLLASGQARPADEEPFYQFVLSMHRFGFLNLPVSDERSLYRRHAARRQSRRRQLWMAPISLRLPLWNPDAFLARTLPAARVLFSRTFVLIWAALMLAAGGLAVNRWSELVQPLNGLLAAQNLPIIWLALIILKAFHELGHAYACRHFGGRVPEIGAYFILLTPCAYVDASAAWGFTRKRDRVIVSLAGVYVESIFAAVALFVWALTPAGLLNSIAYNVIFLASSVTVLFNLNPLMKFDGYYVLSDWLEIPNLAARARAQLTHFAKRRLLGVQIPTSNAGLCERSILMVYGVAATGFQFFLAMAIATLLASKLFIVGFTAAALYVGVTLVRNGVRLFTYLVRSQETASVRGRAIAVGSVGMALVPLSLAAIPAHWGVAVPAEVRAERECVVRARTGGFLHKVYAQNDQWVEAGQPLLALVNDLGAEALRIVEAQVAAATIRLEALRSDSPAEAQQEQARLAALRDSARYRQEIVDELTVSASQAGRVVQCQLERAAGRFFKTGDPLMTVVSGATQVKAVLDELTMVTAKAAPGARVTFRSADLRVGDVEGVIRTVAPSGSRRIEPISLTHLAGGEIVVDADTRESTQGYFEVTIDLLNPPAALRIGMTGRVYFPTRMEPLGLHLLRAMIRFNDRLRIP